MQQSASVVQGPSPPPRQLPIAEGGGPHCPLTQLLTLGSQHSPSEKQSLPGCTQWRQTLERQTRPGQQPVPFGHAVPEKKQQRPSEVVPSSEAQPRGATQQKSPDPTVQGSPMVSLHVPLHPPPVVVYSRSSSPATHKARFKRFIVFPRVHAGRAANVGSTPRSTRTLSMEGLGRKRGGGGPEVAPPAAA